MTREITPEDAREVAELIAVRLFTNGSGQTADRLVLTGKNGEHYGGWSQKAVQDYIERVLKNAAARARSKA